MDNKPVTVRLLDPPLHEFLPQRDNEIEELAGLMNLTFKQVKDKIKSLKETNPMLGFRGCRLGIVYPEISEMQVKAIIEAAKDCGKVMIVTEDRFHGGCSGTIAAVITEGEGLFHLEAPIKHVVPIDARVAYGVDGDNACLPTVDKILAAIEELHNDF